MIINFFYNLHFLHLQTFLFQTISILSLFLFFVNSFYKKTFFIFSFSLVMLERQQIQRKKKVFFVFFLLYIIYKKNFFILFFLFFHILPKKIYFHFFPNISKYFHLTKKSFYDIITMYIDNKTNVRKNRRSPNSCSLKWNYSFFHIFPVKWNFKKFPTVSPKVDNSATCNCIASLHQSTNFLE